MKKDFEAIVYGHQFDFKSMGKMAEGKKFKCAFCGGIGVRYIKVVRDDGAEYQVGMNCAEKTGLKIRSIWRNQMLRLKKGEEVDISGGSSVRSRKKKQKKEKKKEKKKKGLKVGKVEKEKEVLDEDINKILDDLADLDL